MKQPVSQDRATEDRASAGILWSVPIAVAEIPETGRRVDLVADATTRDAIAKATGLAALPRLEASFDLTRQGLDGLHAVGRVSASVVQSCVVTLEPIQNEIEEPVDLVFLPETEVAKAVSEAMLAIDAKEPPEPLRDGAVDLGALAVEFLLLGIDPYPRKPDATFEAPSADDDPASNPFAALAKLKSAKRTDDR
jgi:hypothetical protein